MDDYIPYWIKSTPKTDYPKLTSDINTKNLVIGGGIAGLTTAYLLASQGEDVVLVEANRIAEAVTGHTTAKVTIAHSLIYDYLIREFGLEKAKVYAQANSAGFDFIANFINQYKVDCDYNSNRAFLYTTELNTDKIRAIEKELKATKALGINTSVATGDIGLPFPVTAAISFENQAYFHPRKYLLKMAQEIEKNGGSIFEQTKALNFSNGDNYTIKTTGGTIKAENIIVATNFPIFDLIKLFSRTFFELSYALAARIDGEVSNDSYFSIDDNGQSIRPQEYNHEKILIIGGEPHPSGQENNTLKRYENLENWAKNNFRIKKILAEWSTHDVTGADFIPYIGEQDKGIFIATGFNGWGMTNATMAGILISDMILGKANKNWVEFFNPKRLHKQITAKVIGQNLAVAKDFIKERLHVPEKDFSELEKDEAAIVSLDDQKVAVYKDRRGKIHSFSPKCTHLGCFINWNNAEKTWDCPCHGSRFNYDGEVIHAPAISPLNHTEIKKPED